MKALDIKILKEFLRLAGDNLRGEWLLIGGTLLPAVGLNIRSTIDIDFVGLGDDEARQSLELMDLAESLGLGVETINQSAAYFAKKAGVKAEDLYLLSRGKKAKIYRPSVELYWQLKVARLSEADVMDCAHYFNYCKSCGDKINLLRLKKMVVAAQKKERTPEKALRIEQLLALVDTGL